MSSSAGPLTDMDNMTPEQLASLKRSYNQAILERDQALDANKEKKRKLTISQLGRGIRKNVALAVDVQVLINEWDRRERAVETGEEPAEWDTLTDEEKDERRVQDRNYKSFLILRDQVPGFEQRINVVDDDLSTYTKTLDKGANDARGDDLSNLKKEVANFLNHDYTINPPLDPNSRDLRGLKHDVCGRLLFPVFLSFDDPVVRQKARDFDPEYSTAASYFINAFYPKGRGNPADVEKGFLRSGLLVKVWKYIFTSAGSARELLTHDIDTDENISPNPAKKGSKTKKTTRRCVAEILRMLCVTPRSIAYAAVMLHFALTDAPAWNIDYNGFSYEGLYNTIVDYLEVPASTASGRKHIKDLLAWWNKLVFPNRKAPTTAQASSSFQNEIEQQRAAKEAAVQALVDAQAQNAAASGPRVV